MTTRVAARRPRRGGVFSITSGTSPPIGSNLLNNVYNATRAPSRPQFDSYMLRVQDMKPATLNDLINVLPLSEWTHHACKQGTRIGDTITSNDAESLFNMFGEEVQGMVPLKLLEALVDQPASKCATFSKTGADSSERFTPYAVRLFDEEMRFSKGLVKEYGNHTFKVESRGVHQGPNTVDMKFGTLADSEHVMRCTCGFPMRHAIQCQHVLDAEKHLGRMNIARELIDDGYNAETYRSTYGNYGFRIRPHSIDALEEDPTLLPP